MVLVEDIVSETAHYYRTSIGAILGPSQEWEAVRARHIAIWLTRELTEFSYASIGRMFYRHMDTVRYAVAKVQSQADRSPMVIGQLRDIIDRLAADSTR